MVERRLLHRTFPIVAAIAIGLRFCPTRWLLVRVESFASGPRKQKLRDASPKQVAWAVRVASRLVPGTTCLVQALAAHVLMAPYGPRVRLRVGVKGLSQEEFQAHAWLELDGVPVIGEKEADRFVPFPNLDRAFLMLPRIRFRKVASL